MLNGSYKVIGVPDRPNRPNVHVDNDKEWGKRVGRVVLTCSCEHYYYYYYYYIL
jgi:hypothetical protein